MRKLTLACAVAACAVWIPRAGAQERKAAGGAAATAPVAGPVAAPVAGQVKPEPRYDVPYVTPKVEAIREVTDRLLARLEEQAPAKLVDRRTHEVVTDLGKPTEAVWESGPDHLFTPTNYPMAVVYNGLLMMAEATGDARYSGFVAARFTYFAEALPKLAQWPEGRNRPLNNLLDPNSLDACGAMGASMARAQRMKVGPDLSSDIAKFADYVHTKQFRLADGTLARNSPFPDSIWADDMYMGTSILTQYGALTGKQEYLDDAAKQVVQIAQRLFVPVGTGGGLFTHAWHAGNPDLQPTRFWGRANGWCMVAMADLLSELPADHPQREAVMKLYRAHVQAVAGLQGGRGLWHQMLDRPDSFEETSCTAMFTYAIARGINRGWIDAGTYGPVAQAGWNGLTAEVGPDGRLGDVCIGTNYADDFVYYYHRPHGDDQHGYGPILMAGAEMVRLAKNPRIRIIQSRGGQPPVYREEGKGE